MFEIGDIVKCTCKYTTHPNYNYTCPEEGQILTVREVEHDNISEVCLRFAEIINQLEDFNDGVKEVAFQAKGFKKIGKSGSIIVKEIGEYINF